MSKDEIFKDTDIEPGSFEFNESVAKVFPDMLRRSIPGYDASLEAIGALANRYVSPGTHCYDLGCSLGAATLAMRQNIEGRNCHIVSVDLAPVMVERCRKRIDEDRSDTPVSVEAADIRNIEIRNASMVVLNYTLQFLPLKDRIGLIRKIHGGLNQGGVLVLSEKVADDDPTVESLLVDLHHAFKRANNYSDLEIARKRSALDNVLVPETTGVHLARLEATGFQHHSIWLKHFNFVSILAIR